MGALVASPALSDVFQPDNHASTFGGNPVSCAAALAVLEVMEEEALLKHAEEVSKLFMEGLGVFVDKYKQVLEVRGKGLMIGMVVEGAAKEIVATCQDMGLLCCPAGEHVVRLLPPTNVKDSDLEEALEIANDFAPEHLCLLTSDAWNLVGKVQHAGGVFVGEYSSEALGDYVVGPSHIMPTGRTARFSSPVNLWDFIKITSVFGVSREQASRMSREAIDLAEQEGLSAHAAAVRIRLNQ